ncbi:MAG: TolC family protein [Puniceicoccaceae bacterium]
MKFLFPAIAILLHSLSSLVLLGHPHHHHHHAHDDEEEPLHLEDAIATALLNNFQINRSFYLAHIAESNLISSLSVFDPQQVTSTNLRYDDASASPSTTRSSVSTSTVKSFSSGTSLDLALGARQQNNAPEDEDWNTFLRLGLRQPLLEGAGRLINTADILRSFRERDASLLRLQASAIRIIANTVEAYRTLAFQIERRQVFLLSLGIAESLLEETITRRDLGVATDVDVLRARIGVADRQQAIIQLEEQIGNASDALLTIMGILDPDAATRLEVVPLPVEEDLPLLGREEVFALAHAFDPDTKVRRFDLINRELDFQIARNQGLPALDLVASVDFSGSDSGLSSSTQNTLQRDRESWALGLELRFPWNPRNDRARTDRARFNRTLAALDLEEREQSLEESLRRLWRRVETSQELIQIRTISVQLAEETFSEEQARFESGLSTFRNVSEQQRELDLSRLALLEARLDLLNATSRLEELSGILPSRYGYDWTFLSALLRHRL